MRLLVINGPNINMLSVREPDIYGHQTYSDLIEMMRIECAGNGIDVDFFQSNHEGAIVDRIQEAYGLYEGIIINPAAYTHTSITIPDALKAVDIPAVEVHISDPLSREEFRHISYVKDVCVKTFKGMGLEGYLEAVRFLKNYAEK